MQAYTRKHHTSETLHIVRNTHEDKPMSVEEFFRANFGELPNWAIALRGLRKREGISQASLGFALGIAQTNISQMELGKRTIEKTLAKKFADLLKRDYPLFLRG